jgi:hypothetical protein
MESGGGKRSIGRGSVDHNYNRTVLRWLCLDVTVLLRSGNTLITVARFLAGLYEYSDIFSKAELLVQG